MPWACEARSWVRHCRAPATSVILAPGILARSLSASPVPEMAHTLAVPSSLMLVTAGERGAHGARRQRLEAHRVRLQPQSLGHDLGDLDIKARELAVRPRRAQAGI